MTSLMAQGSWRLLRGGTAWSAEGRQWSVLGDGIWPENGEEDPERCRRHCRAFLELKKIPNVMKKPLLVFSPEFSEF